MTYQLSDLDLARRHLAEAEKRIAAHRFRISDMKRRQQPTEEAEKLLALFLETQREMKIHHDAIQAQLLGR